MALYKFDLIWLIDWLQSVENVRECGNSGGNNWGRQAEWSREWCVVYCLHCSECKKYCSHLVQTRLKQHRVHVLFNEQLNFNVCLPFHSTKCKMSVFLLHLLATRAMSLSYWSNWMFCLTNFRGRSCYHSCKTRCRV